VYDHEWKHKLEAFNDTPHPTRFVSASLADISLADNLWQSLQMALQAELLSTCETGTFVLRKILMLCVRLARDS
jgi:hypothetical protein